MPPADDWRIPERDLYLFNNGKLHRAWKYLGAHPDDIGTRFAVWAPYAREVGVAGEWNGWKGHRTPLEQRGSTGVWEGRVIGVGKGSLYKYELIDSLGELRKKSDPVGFRMEHRPKTSSIVWPLAGHEWGDAEWMEGRAGRGGPMRIYEVHLGSWRRGLSYTDLATELVEYTVSLGFTHLELLPISEYPYDPSWGYQVGGYYAATSRYGTPQELMALVDACHQAGLGVLLDWVPAHFPKDSHGLRTFDGTHLYEHEDPRLGEHKDWDTVIFNYGRPEVANFLMSNALFWLEEFHFDGLRVDAVASMLYRDYSRDEGDWIPNEEGGNEDLEAIAFLKDLNTFIHEEAPGAVMIAEESTSFAGVTAAIDDNGLGFDLKWNMGWMHDSLALFEKDPVYRQFHHDRLTFALYYAFKEKYLLPLSHDEVVHLKKSLLEKMPGDAWRRRANLRLLHAWQLAHPGPSLLFMGGEFGAEQEWNENVSLDWELAENEDNAAITNLVRDLNGMANDHPCLYELDHDWRGFEWIDFRDSERSVISFLRWSKDKKDGMLWLLNFTPIVREGYRVGVPRAGAYIEILNTDATHYGGGDVGNMGEVESEAVPHNERDQSLVVTVPPLAAIAFDLPPVVGDKS
ncbi:MAG: 1,4-alpha-glucan branching protein GlgB [Planctomycetota bacterium]